MDEADGGGKAPLIPLRPIRRKPSQTRRQRNERAFASRITPASRGTTDW